MDAVAGNGLSQLVSASSPAVVFRSGSIVNIDAGDGADNVQVNSLDSTAGMNLNVFGEDGNDLLTAFHAVGRDKLSAAIPSLKERARTLAELAQGALYLVALRPLTLDAKAKALIDADAKAAIAALADQFAKANDWTAPALETLVRAHAEATGAKLGKLAQALRAALTGRAVSPPVFDVMAVLGRDETLARLREQV